MNTKTKKILKHLWSLLVVAFLAVIFVQLLSFISQQLESNLGKEFLDRFGVLGIYISLALIDSFPTPGGAVPILFLAVQGGTNAFFLFFLCLLSSYSVAIIGFFLGKTFGIPQKWLNKLEHRYGKTLQKVRNNDTYGFLILIALPIPISLASWTGGSFGFSFRALIIGMLARVPKILIYLFASLSSLQGS